MRLLCKLRLSSHRPTHPRDYGSINEGSTKTDPDSNPNALVNPKRYGSTRFNKQSRQKMFQIWAKKEHRNLLRLYRAGVPCPEPLKQREHTLVLSFIGKDHWPAPQLREIDLSKRNWRRFVCVRSIS